MSDNINPDHYKRLPAEAIEIIESAIDNAPSAQDAYLHGQVLKYVLRCWHKNGIEDLRKAKWYLDRLIDSFDESELKELAWTPKIGDWVRIKNIDSREAWVPEMDKYDKKIVQVEEFDGRAIVHDEWCFLFEWLEPVEQPAIKQSLPTEPPDGWRFLEVGEVIRKGDRCFTSNSGSIDCLTSVGEKFNHEAHYPTIRRNQFEVGEKVIGGLDGFEFVVVGKHSRLNDAYVVRNKITGTIHNILGRLLAPYIEDAK